ncbi:hypothetical protein WJX72_007537 [[Myrmecia] bisecta]|uniref:PDEase domain-containing protein n=1 Tax=[Myrmecia] bisecta TaxID=41462 RepID=A0AAW1QRF0_9CHLO
MGVSEGRRRKSFLGCLLPWKSPSVSPVEAIVVKTRPPSKDLGTHLPVPDSEGPPELPVRAPDRLISSVVDQNDLRHLSFSRPEGSLNPRLQDALEKVNSWDEFDVFKVAEFSNGRPLYTVAMALLEQEGCLECKIDRQKAQKFLTAVEAAYQPSNPYHNSTHAADVTQAAMVLLKSGNAMFSPLETFSLIVAATVHDLAHPGFTNDFLINTRHERAVVYNDRSVNENYHVSTCFRIAANEETNIFSGLTKQEFNQCRRMIINAVLSTDMTQHFTLIERFTKGKLAEPDVSKWEDKDLLLQMVLHAADLCNPCRPKYLSVKWAELVLMEFLEQGDTEASLGMDVTPMCDRRSVVVSTNQLRFIQWFLRPTMEECRTVTGDAFFEAAMRSLEETERHWQEHEKLALEGKANPHAGFW